MNSMKPKEFIESINMIKDLLQSNIVLRQNIEKLNKLVDKKDSELYHVIKENQVLRDRWQAVSPLILAEHQQEKQLTLEEQRNYSTYQKLMEDRSGLKPISLRKPKTNQSGTMDSGQKSYLNLSYNDILKQRSPGRREHVRKRLKHSYV